MSTLSNHWIGIATHGFDPGWFALVYKIVDCAFWEFCELFVEYTEFFSRSRCSRTLFPEGRWSWDRRKDSAHRFLGDRVSKEASVVACSNLLPDLRKCRGTDYITSAREEP